MASDSYAYGGARALVELHERYLREFLEAWREADARGVELPATSDPNYTSREVLLAHVLGCAARYLTWMCEQLEVAVPEVEEHPSPAGLEQRAESYIEQVLDAWRIPLRTLTEKEAYAPAHVSRWGSPYCIDAMLEHAVMHPLRHAHQLRGLMTRDLDSAG